MFKSSSANQAKLKKLIVIFLQMPQMQLRDAMKLAKYSNKEIADVAFRRFLQRALPGGSRKGLRVYVAEEVALLPAPPDCSKRCLNCSINDNIERTPSVNPAANHQEYVLASANALPKPNPHNVSNVGTLVLLSSTLATAKKCKQYNCAYY
jgi:hypothetical protein